MGGLKFCNVSAAYSSDPEKMVLDDVDFEIQPNTTVALVGHNGSGKSTLLKILLKLYQMKSGEIRLDGVSINSINTSWLMTQIGWVAQNSSLFEGKTIYENVVHGLCGTLLEDAPEEVKRKRVAQACKIANIENRINDSEKKYDTKIDGLSDGEKQCVSIARALARDPKILLLDEHTAKFDSSMEILIQRALKKASEGRTVIIVAHKLQTIENAQNIVVLKNGKVVAQGTHKKLFNSKQPHYMELHKAAQAQESQSQNKEDDTALSAWICSPFSAISACDYTPLEMKSKPQTLSDWQLAKILLGLMWTESPTSFIWGSACAILNGLVFPAFALVYGQMMDVFTTTDDRASKAKFWGSMFLAVAVVKLVVEYGQVEFLCLNLSATFNDFTCRDLDLVVFHGKLGIVYE